MSTLGKIGYALQALVRRYRRWMAEPKFFEFGFVVVMALIATVLSTTGVIDQGFGMEEEADLRESFAKAVEQSPDVWLEQLEARKGKVSEYEYRLEYQRYRWFARNAPSLAERIRDEKVWGVFKQSSKMVAEQTAQLAVGKIAGKGARVIGKPAGQAGSELLAKGVATESKVYRAAGRFIGRHGRRLAIGGEVIGETASNLAWETTSALTAEPKDMSPALKKAMEREENRELFKLIKKALRQDPDKMMEAALYQEINIIGNAKEDSDEDYAKSVRIGARSLRKLTQAGGSPTSMWKDEEELAKWLASKVGRALPEVKEEEEPTPPSGCGRCGQPCCEGSMPCRPYSSGLDQECVDGICWVTEETCRAYCLKKYGPDFISQVLDDGCTCKFTRKDLAMERNRDG